ncbi:MAG: 2-amino-4-hydroxy-6-hydroxymethyldihydropteridine diphosphokinase [Clostridiales bacterium]|nr:2-amino-4-hydroxy-6-hydroxymethyldihydropteridine diphosphokinase [Clostridiales bacterium]
MKTAIVGIGTNIGDRRRNVESAIEALKHLPNTEIAAVSPIYETEPWGYTEQNRFYNVCVKISTELSPSALLGACLGIEAAFGRERPFKNSPRIIDIDLLLYEEAELNTPELTLPHPRMRERAFVLVPLKDILTDLKFGGYNFNEDFEKCDKNAVKKL